MDHRLRTAWHEGDLDSDPDGLYHLLDGLVPGANPTARLAPATDDGSFVEVTATREGPFEIRFAPPGAAAAQAVADADILAAHRTLWRYAHADPQWIVDAKAADGTARGFAGNAAPIDYRETGLTIATAMVDAARRRRRQGAAPAVPPMIHWGGREVITGDVWTATPETGRLTIRVTAVDPARDHGIAVSAMGGTLRLGDEPPAAELILWPRAGLREFTVGYTTPRRTLALCNVFTLPAPAGPRLERWQENAGMLRTVHSGSERSYDCNHAASTPPGFTDLSFTATLAG